MSWLSEAFHKIEKEVIRPVAHTINEAYDDVEDEIKRSEIAQAALIGTGAVLAAPVVLPVLGATAGGAATLAGGAVSGAGTLAGGAVSGAGSLLGNIWKGVTGIFGGTGEIAGVGGSGDVAAAAMENQAWTDIASVAMENQPLTSAGSWGLGDIFGTIGSVLKTVPGAIETLANVLPQTKEIISVFGGDEPAGPIQQSKPPTSSPPIILQTTETPIPGERSSTQPIFYQTPAGDSGSPNMMLYIAIAAVVYFLLR